MHVVTGTCSNGAQQGAVDPRDDRAVQLARTVEALSIILHGGNEDVLDLEVTPRVQQRQCVREALGRSPRQLKPYVVRRRVQQFVDVLAPESGRDMGLIAINRTEP